MMSDLFLKDYDLNIIDFNELFTTDIQFEIIDSLYEFDLLEKSINNSSVKKFFLHWIILSICDKILKNKNKSIIYFNYTQLEDCELKKYYNETEILIFLNSNLRRVEKLEFTPGPYTNGGLIIITSISLTLLISNSACSALCLLIP